MARRRWVDDSSSEEDDFDELDDLDFEEEDQQRLTATFEDTQKKEMELKNITLLQLRNELKKVFRSDEEGEAKLQQLLLTSLILTRLNPQVLSVATLWVTTRDERLNVTTAKMLQPHITTLAKQYNINTIDLIKYIRLLQNVL